jgi:hypothetical protein
MERTAWVATPQAVRGRKRQVAKIYELYRLLLFRLCKMRHANHFLPDSADGRALLKALLRCKLSADAAKEAACWLEPSELPALQRAAQRVRLHDVGKLVSLTYDERESGRLWLLRPCDVPWPEVQRRTRERSIKADRERKRRKRQELRERREMMRNTPRRDDAIMRMLSTDWTPVSEIVQQARTVRVFRCGDVVRWGGSLREAFRGAATSGSLRKLVHRTLDQLEGLGVVETELRKGTRGLVRWARKVDLEPALRPDAFCHGDSVTGGIGCRENTKTDDAAKPSGVAKNVRSKPKNRVRCNNGASGYVSSEPQRSPPWHDQVWLSEEG